MKRSTARSVKRILVALLLLLVVIQFFRPAKNISHTIQVNDITKKYEVPQDVQQILKASCYDCHSNNTVYPWYAEVQPVAWWLNGHITDGKRGLNFSEFSAYRIGKQYGKLDDINELVKNGGMPLQSYLIIHTYARLSDQQKTSLINWATSLRATIKASYPADSLIKKKRS